MPLDTFKLKQQLAQLEEYLIDMRALADRSREEFSPRSDTEALAERRVHKVVQAVLDIAASVNAQLGLGVPKTYREVMDNLVDSGVIDEELATRLKQMVGLRNILTHEYASIDPEFIYKAIHEDEKDVVGFVEAILHLVDKEAQRTT